jgi:hypothetical protein
MEERNSTRVVLDARKHVHIPLTGQICAPQERLEDMPPKVSLRLQKDALDVLESVLPFLALEETRRDEAGDLLDGVVDVLVRGGRL